MKEYTDQRKSDFYFDPLLEFNAPRFYDFNNEEINKFKEIDEWFRVDHSVEYEKEDISTNQKLTYSFRNKDIFDAKNLDDEESKLEELIKLHNEKIRKRKSCTLQGSQFMKFDVTKRKKYSEINKDKILNTSISDSFSKRNLSNNIINIEVLTKNHLKRDIVEKNEIISRVVNKRIKENISVNNSNTLHKAFTNILPKVNKIKIEKTRENKFKYEVKNHIVSSSMKLRNKEGNCSSKSKITTIPDNSAKLNKSKSMTYCPRIYDAKTLKKWKLLSKKDFYQLSPHSRNEANREIAEMIKNNKL